MHFLHTFSLQAYLDTLLSYGARLRTQFCRMILCFA